MKVGLIAPPWISVPPRAYGGTESMIDVLARGLAKRGHEVELFATGDSTCPVRVHSIYPNVMPMPSGADKGAGAMADIAQTHVHAALTAFEDVDIIHDHTQTALEFAAPGVPVVTTMHNPIDTALRNRMARWPTNVHPVAISHAQAQSAPGVDFATVIHHGVNGDQPIGDGSGDYLLFLGRMAKDKGVREAIDIALATNSRLLIAAKLRDHAEATYYANEVQPYLCDKIVYVGEVSTAAKFDLLRNARALINPIRWNEPFGLVMIEAFSVGTPVIATARGSVREIVTHSHTGYICHTVEDAIEAVGDVGSIDRQLCQEIARGRFSADTMIDRYEQLYRRVLADGGVKAPKLREADNRQTKRRTPLKRLRVIRGGRDGGRNGQNGREKSWSA